MYFLDPLVISGPDSEENHCVFEHSKGHVILNPLDSKCTVNEHAISKPTRLFQGNTTFTLVRQLGGEGMIFPKEGSSYPGFRVELGIIMVTERIVLFVR